MATDTGVTQMNPGLGAFGRLDRDIRAAIYDLVFPPREVDEEIVEYNEETGQNSRTKWMKRWPRDLLLVSKQIYAEAEPFERKTGITLTINNYHGEIAPASPPPKSLRDATSTVIVAGYPGPSIFWEGFQIQQYPNVESVSFRDLEFDSQPYFDQAQAIDEGFRGEYDDEIIDWALDEWDLDDGEMPLARGCTTKPGLTMMFGWWVHLDYTDEDGEDASTTMNFDMTIKDGGRFTIGNRHHQPHDDEEGTVNEKVNDNGEVYFCYEKE